MSGRGSAAFSSLPACSRVRVTISDFGTLGSSRSAAGLRAMSCHRAPCFSIRCSAR